jgi:predicted dehydrogenase
MAKTLGFGILGAGLVSPFHAKSIVASHGGELIAFCDMNAERLKKLTDEYKVKGYASLTEMLKDPRIDVVNVCTPNHLHHAAVLEIAAAGKHCLTEKPPAMSLHETDEMIAACKKAGVKFGCTVQCRVRQAIQAMKSAIDSGRFGKLLHADAYMKWYRAADYYHMDAWRSSRQSGAGVTVQHAFHYIDLLQYLMGPARRVEARMSNLAHPDVQLEDTLLAFVDFKNGAQGVVQASTGLWPGTDIRIEINGANGTAIMVGEKMVMWKFKEERPEDETIRQFGNASQGTAATGPAAFSFQDHAVVIQDLIDAVNQNREVCIPVSAVRPTLEMVLAMYHSAAKGKPVNLPVQDDPSVWNPLPAPGST